MLKVGDIVTITHNTALHFARIIWIDNDWAGYEYIEDIGGDDIEIEYLVKDTMATLLYA